MSVTSTLSGAAGCPGTASSVANVCHELHAPAPLAFDARTRNVCAVPGIRSVFEN